jgi:hypothetical protein
MGLMSLFEYTNNLILSRTQIGQISNPRGSVVKLSGIGFDITFNNIGQKLYLCLARRKYKGLMTKEYKKHIVSLRIISNDQYNIPIYINILVDTCYIKIYKTKYSRKDLVVHKGALKCRSTYVGLSREQIVALFRRVELSKNPIKCDRKRFYYTQGYARLIMGYANILRILSINAKSD